MLTPSDALRLARLYGEALGISLSTVGKHAINNQHVFNRIEKGSSANSRSLQQLETFFIVNWPDTVPWPDDIAKSKRKGRPPMKPPTSLERYLPEPRGMSVTPVSDQPNHLRLQVDQVLPRRLAMEIMVMIKEFDLELIKKNLASLRGDAEE